MGTIELINFGMSAFGSGGLTIAGNVINSLIDGNVESRKLSHKQDGEKFDKTEKSQKSAREFKGNPGFHKTRQWIAKVIIFCYFVLPLTLPFFAACIGLPVTIMLGYYDVSHGWPWQESIQNVQWITIGAEGSFPIVITPVMNNTVISIIGMFFGNQMVKSK